MSGQARQTMEACAVEKPLQEQAMRMSRKLLYFLSLPVWENLYYQYPSSLSSAPHVLSSIRCLKYHAGKQV